MEDLESAGEEEEGEEIVVDPEHDLPPNFHISQQMMESVLEELGLAQNTGQAEDATEEPPPPPGR